LDVNGTAKVPDVTANSKSDIDAIASKHPLYGWCPRYWLCVFFGNAALYMVVTPYLIIIMRCGKENAPTPSHIYLIIIMIMMLIV